MSAEIEAGPSFEDITKGQFPESEAQALGHMARGKFFGKEFMTEIPNRAGEAATNSSEALSTAGNPGDEPEPSPHALASYPDYNDDPAPEALV